MKLKNVHYEYRGNDIWRIYFKDYAEMETFRNERTDGKKPRYSALCANNLGIRYYVEAKLTGQFNVLRRYAKDLINDYFSSDPWTNLVKKIEGTDSDYIFDEIDLWYNDLVDKCYFRIRCMNGTWTDLFVKNMLNSQFGMMAQANGYYDTDTVGKGGFCVRRSCCGIGFDPSVYKTDKERIIFTVKNFCRGEADIIKVSAWTHIFIGTNKEDEKEYSWIDFKHYMGLLHANGSDIWDIEWKYDAACPMTGTEIVDKIHLYLKPLAYKRLFAQEEKKERVKKVWLSTGSLWTVTNPSFDRLHDLTPQDADEVQKEIDEAWHEYLSATEMARLGADFDGDTICEYCKQDVDICKDALSANDVEPIDLINRKEKEAINKEEKNMGPKDTTFAEYCRRLYWGAVVPVKSVKPTKILIQGTATIIWWSDGTKTIVKCQKGDKMDPEKGIAMCVMKKFMGTNETHSNYLDFAKDAIAVYEAKQKAMAAARKKAADKKRRAAKKEEKGNGEV